jgi:hypothetical protein
MADQFWSPLRGSLYYNLNAIHARAWPKKILTSSLLCCFQVPLEAITTLQHHYHSHSTPVRTPTPDVNSPSPVVPFFGSYLHRSRRRHKQPARMYTHNGSSLRGRPRHQCRPPISKLSFDYRPHPALPIYYGRTRLQAFPTWHSTSNASPPRYVAKHCAV